MGLRISFPLLWYSSLAILSLILQASSTLADTCSNVAPQPIGIDFGARAVIATYAHSDKNISLMATIIPSDDEPYRISLARLRMEHFNFLRASGFLGGVQPEKKTALQLVTEAVQQYLPDVGKVLKNYPAITNSSQFIWAQQQLNTLKDATISVVVSLISELDSSARLHAMNDQEFNYTYIETGFVTALNVLKDKAYEEHQTNIKFAIISTPDFFNDTIKSLLFSALDTVGIEHTKKTMRRTYTSVLGSGAIEGERVLSIDHGTAHFVLASSNQIIWSAGGDKSRYKNNIYPQTVPLDHLGSIGIDRILTGRVIEKSDWVKEQIRKGADRFVLHGKVTQARAQIKDSLDAEVMGMGMDEDHHHEEWPLDLGDWGVDGKGAGEMLKWEDVLSVEEEYVTRLSGTMKEFLISIRQFRTKSQDQIPEAIDSVVILTETPDGSLLRKAVRRAIGDQVKILGGVMGNMTMAAEGAGLLALKRLESWKAVQREKEFDFGNLHNEHSEL